MAAVNFDYAGARAAGHSDADIQAAIAARKAAGDTINVIGGPAVPGKTGPPGVTAGSGLGAAAGAAPVSALVAPGPRFPASVMSPDVQQFTASALGFLPALYGGAGELMASPLNLAGPGGTAADIGAGALAGAKGEVDRRALLALLGLPGGNEMPHLGTGALEGAGSVVGGKVLSKVIGGLPFLSGAAGRLANVPLVGRLLEHAVPGFGLLAHGGQVAGQLGSDVADEVAMRSLGFGGGGGGKIAGEIGPAGRVPPVLGESGGPVGTVGNRGQGISAEEFARRKAAGAFDTGRLPVGIAPPAAGPPVAAAAVDLRPVTEPAPAVPEGQHLVREHLRTNPTPKPKPEYKTPAERRQDMGVRPVKPEPHTREPLPRKEPKPYETPQERRDKMGVRPIKGPPGTGPKPKAGPPSGEKLADRLAAQVAKGKTPGKVAGHIGPPGTDVSKLPESWRSAAKAPPGVKVVPEAPELGMGPRHEVQYFSESRGEYVDIEKMNQKHIEQAYNKLAAKNPKPGSVGRRVLDALLNESKHRLEATGIHVGQGR